MPDQTTLTTPEDQPMTANPQHVYVVNEIRDGVPRRTHGYHASLNSAFNYCETEERKKPLIDSVRFELFPVPGGTQWLIHQFYGPDDDWPEISDFVISQHAVVNEEPAAALPTPADRAAVLQDFLWRLEQSAGDAAAEKFLDDNPELRRMADEAHEAGTQQQPGTKTPAEDPARIDRLRPESTDHASVESINAQIQRARSQQRRWHLRAEWLIGLRQARVEQKARGEWPAPTIDPDWAAKRRAAQANNQEA